MSVEAESPASLSEFQDADKIGIAQLNPDAGITERAHIEANVALVWPYSSSTKKLSLLLVEKDVRLRASKGQVKVTFHGDCARRVAETRIGIGAGVKLGLEAVQWKRTGDIVSTPGKKVDWDIDISKRVQLEIKFSDGRSTVVNLTAEPLSAVTTDTSTSNIGPLSTNGIVDIRKTGLLSSQSTPKRVKNVRLSSGSFVDASLDPFADDDGYIFGKGRKRTRFTRSSGAWQVVDTEKPVLVADEEQTPSSPLLQHVNSEAVQPLLETPEIHLAPANGDVNTELASPVVRPIGNTPQAVEKVLVPEVNGDIDQDLGGFLTIDDIQLQQESKVLTQDIVITEQHLPDTSAIDDLNSPTEPERIAQDDTENQDLIADDVHASTPGLSPLLMPPPSSLSSLTPEPQARPVSSISDQLLMIPTPVLQPILSPGLALVSPLIGRPGLETAYFTNVMNLLKEPKTASQVAIASESPVSDTSSSIGGGLIEDIEDREILPDLGDTEVEQQAEIPSPKPINQDLPDNKEINDHANRSGLHFETETLHQADALPSYNSLLADPDSTSAGVDLDALQQQIDESSRSVEENAAQPYWDDEDMYDPPARTQQHAVLDGAKNETNSLARLEQILPLTEPIAVSRSPIIFDISSDELMSNNQGDSEGESGDDNESELDSEAEVTNEEKEDSDLDGDVNTTDEEAIDSGQDAEHDTDSLVNPNNIPVMSNDLGSQTATTIAGFATILVPAPVNDEIVTDSSAPLSSERPINQSDGLIEVFEDEELRERLRSRSATAGTSNAAPTLASSSSSLISESSGPHEDDVIPEEADESQDAAILPSPLEHDVLGKHAVQPPAAPTRGSETELKIDELGEPSDPSPPTANVSHAPQTNQSYEGEELILTPDATQQEQLHVDSGVRANFGVSPQTLPISPQLTQPRTTTAPAQSSDLDSGVDEERITTSSMPQMADKPSKPLPRLSQRLSRKSVAGETTGNQYFYFTPRRSSRNVQSSPTPDSHQIPFIQPSSSPPPRAQRSLRSSSPVMVREPVREGASLPAESYGTTTKLTYFPSFSSLTQYFGLQVDVIGVCSVDPTPAQKAKTGPRDYHISLYLTDPSFAESKTSLVAQIFRPRKNALPIAERGDVLLLRNMKVQTSNHQPMLISTDFSAWATFKKDSDGKFQVSVTGPPIEYDEAENSKAIHLSRWWLDNGSFKYPESLTSTTNLVDQTNRRSTSPMVTRSHARKISASEHSVDDGQQRSPTKYKLPEIRERSSSPVNPLGDRESLASKRSPSPNARRSTRKPRHRRGSSERSASVVHELRDGTQYIDNPTSGRHRSASVIHELRDGSTYVDE